MRRIGFGLVSVVWLLVAVACGSGDEEPETTTTVPTSIVEEAPTTTSYLQNPCFGIPTEVLRLQNDYRDAVRTFAGADEAEFRARAQALVDRAAQNGCPPPSVNSFLNR
ncbi:MAG: hypothetical protein ABR540_00625 [Acidimicrobiales bacterium]|nr:hypothetical protein [Actinomycetota bacterium]